jgi:hypothetical protein
MNEIETAKAELAEITKIAANHGGMQWLRGRKQRDLLARYDAAQAIVKAAPKAKPARAAVTMTVAEKAEIKAKLAAARAHRDRMTLAESEADHRDALTGRGIYAED